MKGVDGRDLRLLDEQPDYGDGPGRRPTAPRLAAHFENRTLVVASQALVGELSAITDKIKCEVKVHGGYSLTWYLNVVIERCKGKKLTLDIVDHSTIRTGIITLSGVDISRKGLLAERHSLEFLTRAIAKDAIGEIRLLGCYTGVDEGARNVRELAEFLGVRVVGTKVAVNADHFDDFGLVDGQDVLANGDEHPRKASVSPSGAASDRGWLPNFVRFQWPNVETKACRAEHLPALWACLESPWPSHHDLEIPIATLSFVGAAEALRFGYHVEILDGYNNVRFYRSGVEWTASVSNREEVIRLVGTGGETTVLDLALRKSIP